jgi:SRSO17 transposase
VNPIFTVTVDSHTRELLELVAQFFKDQNRRIYKVKHKQAYQYHLGKRSLLQQQVIRHFDRYPLLGRRADQFEMLKFVCDQLQKGRDLEGARAIVKFIYAKSSGRRKRRLTLSQFLRRLESLF